MLFSLTTNSRRYTSNNEIVETTTAKPDNKTHALLFHLESDTSNIHARVGNFLLTTLSIEKSINDRSGYPSHVLVDYPHGNHTTISPSNRVKSSNGVCQMRVEFMELRRRRRWYKSIGEHKRTLASGSKKPLRVGHWSHTFLVEQKASSIPVDAMTNPLQAMRKKLGHLRNLLWCKTPRTAMIITTLERSTTIAV